MFIAELPWEIKLSACCWNGFIMRSFVLRSARLNFVCRRSDWANRRGRRTGQALLLAVLLMVFAALVASTFITVVSLNMDATATQEERQRAASAANAGQQVINYQLNSNGTDWRPEQVSPPPAPGDAEYSYYYTAQDLVHGYARSTLHPAGWNPAAPDYAADWAAIEADKANGARVFVKFPDPRLEQNTGSHTYMAEVAVAGAGEGTDKQGMLRITVVGQSSDDPNVFIKNVAYKGTEAKNGAFAWGLFDTNWNYDKNATVATEWVPSASVSANTTNTIAVKDARGIAPGRILVLQQGAVFEYAMVAAVNNNTITLKSNNIQAYAAGTVAVRAATTLMNDPVGFEGAAQSPAIAPQFDADGEATSSAFEAILPQARVTNAGFYFNTDVLVRGKAYMVLGTNQEMKVAGLLNRYTNLATPTAETIAQVVASPTGMPVEMPASATNPADPTRTIGSSSLPNPEQKRIYDNPNIAGPESALTDPLRSVQPQVPPQIEQFTKLLEDTKYQPGGSVGLGPNLYIDNGQDREKVQEGGALRELTVSDMHRLWQGKSFPSLGNVGNAAPPISNPGNPDDSKIQGGTQNFRLSCPRLVLNGDAAQFDGYTYPQATGSLEQRGVRGWVSPYEFLPRGALIELQGDTIVVTLDSTSDANPTAPNANKAWPWATNASTPMPKAYRMEIDTLTNAHRVGLAGAATQTTYTPALGETFGGIIYAEGNLRVRGTSGSRPLTIVSLNNIYIEGKLRQGSATGRIALLAKKNVVLNPTQFITRAEGSEDRSVGARATAANVRTLSGTGAAATPLYLTADASDATANTLFRVGDWVRIGTARTESWTPSNADLQWRRVEYVRPDNGLVLAPALSAASAANTPISLLFDPPVVSGRDTALYPASVAGVATAGSRTVGDIYQVEEYFYRLGGSDATSIPTSSTLMRDARFDGLVGATGSGGSYQLAARLTGERKEAVALQFIGQDTNPAPPPPRIDTTLQQPYNFSVREDINGDSNWDTAEDLFTATSMDSRFRFSIDLRNLTGSGAGGDASETIALLKAVFNIQQANKWKLNEPMPNGGLYDAFILNTGSTGPNDDSVVAARYLARVGPINGTPDDQVAAAFIFTNDEIMKLPLTVAVGLNWQTNLQTMFGPGTSVIGTNPNPVATQSLGDVETARRDFYWFNNASSGDSDKQQWLHYLQRTLSAPGIGSNLIALERDPNTSAVLPALRVGAWKLEADDFSGTGTPRAYTPIEVPIEATIFAQEGSWFVIPLPKQHRTDSDSDGSPSPAEIAAATRYNRMNYKITVTGTLVQNYSPTALDDYDNELSPDSVAGGAMRQWMDSYAYPTEIESDGVTAPNGPNPRGLNWMTIQYDNSPVLPLNSGLYLPPSPNVSVAN